MNDRNDHDSLENIVGQRHGRDGVDDVSPLEQEVLDEYARLAGNMDKLSQTLTSLTTSTAPPTDPNTSTTPQASFSIPPAPSLTLEIAESLRLLERKVASVYTLMKASVYSIVLQQGEVDMGNSMDDSMLGMGRAEGDENALQGEGTGSGGMGYR